MWCCLDVWAAVAAAGLGWDGPARVARGHAALCHELGANSGRGTEGAPAATGSAALCAVDRPPRVERGEQENYDHPRLTGGGGLFRAPFSFFCNSS